MGSHQNRGPKPQVSLSEVQSKTNGFIVPQLFVEEMYYHVLLYRPVIVAERIWEDQQSSELSRKSACKFCLAVVLLHWVRDVGRM